MSNWPVTTTYAPAGSQRNRLKTPEIWLRRFNESVWIGHQSSSIESGAGGTEDTEAVGTFHWTVFLHFPLFSFDWMSAQYKWCRRGLFKLPIEQEFHRAPIPPKGPHYACRSVMGPMGLYDCVCKMIVSYFVSLSHYSLIYWFFQPRRSAPREGDYVTATRDPRPG